MSKSLKKLIDINRLREFKNKLVGVGSAYVQTTAVDQTIAGTKTFSKPIVGSVTGSSGSCAGNAASASSVPWSGVTGKPSTFTPSSHTHDDRYYTEAEVNNLLEGKANSSHTHPYIPTSASCNKNWNWSGRGGQPTWLWGGEDGINMYVYNPSDFRVNYANSASSAAIAANGVDSYGDDWIRFINGIQICTGTTPSIEMYPDEHKITLATFPKSFNTVTNVITCSMNPHIIASTWSIYNTRCEVFLKNTSGGIGSYFGRYIAFGKWK